MTPLTGPAPLTADETRSRVEKALGDVLAEQAGDDPFRSDLRTFLAGFESIGTPRLFELEGKPVRYLTPLMRGGKVGAIVATCPFTGEVLAWPGWQPGPEPAFLMAQEEMLAHLAAGDPRVAEFVPKTNDRANRYAVTRLDLESATLLDGYERLPYKNQEERWDWVEQVKASGKMRTRWLYSPGVQYPAYKCLSYASSTVADWWGWRLGRPPTGRYRNFVNGLQEYGVNPRELEVLYHHRAKTNPVVYARLPPVGHGKDPVTRERIPTSLRGYARLLTTPEDLELADHLFKSDAPTYAYWPGKYHMDSQPRILFTANRYDEGAIVGALEKHGIVFAMTQTRLLGIVRIGLHAIAIVGHYVREGQLTFIYHESYGNKAAGYHWDNSGGPGLMSIPARMLRGAICFPHRVWVDLADGELCVRHSEGGCLEAGRGVEALLGGEPVPLEQVGPGRYAIRLERASSLEIVVRHRHFHAPDGGPRRLTIVWPGHTGPGPERELARWCVLDRQAADPALSHVPQWVVGAQSEAAGAFAEWAKRAGRSELDRRLGPLRSLVLGELSRVESKRMLTAFPGLR